MGIGGSVRGGRKEKGHSRIYIAELRDIENNIKEVDQFIKRSQSLYSFTEYPLKVETLVNKTVNTMETVHEYAGKLYESIIILRKKTNDLLQNMQGHIRKLAEEISDVHITKQEQMTLTQFSDTRTRLDGQETSSANRGYLTETLENMLMTAEASLQNQNLQAIIEKTTELLLDIRVKSEIHVTDKAELQDLLAEWIRNTKLCEDARQIKEEGKQHKVDDRATHKTKEEESFIYEILDNQHETGDHNDGVCCVVFASPDVIVKDDLICSCSDHSAYNIRECISDDEQIASLITNIKSATLEKLSLKIPLRVYIPYHMITEDNRTVAVKVSVNDEKWNRAETLEPYTLPNKQHLQFVGFQINSFTNLKILAVTIITPETLLVPEEGITYNCIGDKDVSIKIPESTFKEPTQISLTVNNIPKCDISAAKANHAVLSDVCEATSVISFDCDTATNKPFNLQFSGLGHLGNSENFNAMYHVKDGKWKFADCTINGTVANVTILEDVSHILFIGLFLPRDTPIEHVLESAIEMVKHSNEIKMHAVFKQKNSNFNDTIIACVSSVNKGTYVNELMTQGYSAGPVPSKEFCISEGENVHLRFSGNIDAECYRSTLKVQRNYPDCMICNLFAVDENIQRDEQYFRGNLKFLLENESANSQKQLAQFPVYLEKEGHHNVAFTYRSRFVMETKETALAKYIAWKLNINGDRKDWDKFVHALEDENMIRRLTMKTKWDSQHETKRKKCEEFMKSWIKEKPQSVNKVRLISVALEKCGFNDIKISAERFIKFFDGNGILSDNSLMKMAEKIGLEWKSLGISLGLTTADIEQIETDSKKAKYRIYNMLNQWRMSDHAIEFDHAIVSKLVEAMVISNCHSELFDFVRLNLNPGNAG